MTVTLAPDKTIVKGDEEVTFTVGYPPEYAGKEVTLQEQSFTGSRTVVATEKANSSGRTVFKLRISTQGKHTYAAFVSPCYVIFNCEYSNDVFISVENAPCDPWDIGCRLTPQLDTKLIAAAVAIVIVIFIILIYFPKKR